MSASSTGFFHIMHNISNVFLLGFPHLQRLNILFFVFLSIIYFVTICGNGIIITVVSMSKPLHSPMYFFITLLAILDVLMITDILPNLLSIVLHDGGSMSLAACLSQFYVFAVSETSECFILMVMSYDRYLAICNPLRYNAIMNKTFCYKSVIVSLFLSCILMMINEIHIYTLPFCGPNSIDHFFCDFLAFVGLSCSDTSLIRIQGALLGVIVITFPFILIIVSYVNIITTILNIRSVTGRHKVFSTCSSHLTVVCIFFGSLFLVYMVPAKEQLLSTSKALSLLYTVVTPLLNPFIYSLRNKELKDAFKKIKDNLF